MGGTQPVPAIEIGGTHVTAALVDLATGLVIAGSARRLPLPADEEAKETVGRIVACASGLEVAGGATWGVAIPGPFDYSRGIGRFEPGGKFAALNGIDLRRELLDGLGRAAQEITFINDADAFLIGEWIAGAAAGHDRAAAITLGTGVGSAFLADGVIVDDGPDVPPEGRVDLLEIGGRRLEETVSRRALLALYAASTGRPVDPAIDVRELAQLARHGDRVALEVLDTSLGALGHAVAPWLERFGAKVLVVGGSIARSWDLVEGPLRRELFRGRPNLRARMLLAPALQPDEAALIGVAAYATPVRRHSASR